MNKFMEYDFCIKEIVLACYVGKGEGLSKHRNRASHGLAFMLDGNKDYIFSCGKRINTKKNDIIYLPKHSDYDVKSIVSGDCYAINFDVDEEISFDAFVMSVKNSANVMEHFKTARKIWTAKRPGYELKCKAELYNILYLMQKEYLAEYIPHNKYEIVRPAVDYIHKHYTDELLNIEELAGLCGITPVYFRKLFAGFYGTSPIKYINNLKITRAKELLISQMYSISEVAMQSGYSDMSHFSREFKKATGICPSEYIGD